MGNLTGVALPFVLTAFLGSGRTTDGYFLAAAAANFVVILTVGIEAVCLPYFARLRLAPDQAPGELVGKLLGRSILCSVGLTVPSYLVTSFVIVPHTGFTSGQQAQVRLLLLVLAPLPLAAACSSVLASAHYAFGRFWLPTATQGLRSAAALLCVLSGGAGVSLAVAAGALTVGELTRTGLLYRRLPFTRPSITQLLSSGTVVGYWATTLPAVLATVIVGVNPLIDKAVASGTGASGITTLELAEKLFYVPTILFGGMVASVLTSQWASLHVETGSTVSVAPSFWRSQRLILAGSGAVTAVGVVVVLLLGPAVAGQVGLDDGQRFAAVLAIYLLGLPAALYVEVAARLITTLRVNRVLPWVSAIALVLNLVLDLIGRALLGLAGIALATGLVRAAGGVIMTWWLLRVFAADRTRPVGPSPASQGAVEA